jgi:hypothetical protein
MYEFRGTKGLTLAANAKRKNHLKKKEVTSELNDKDSNFGSVMFRSQYNQKLNDKANTRFNTGTRGGGKK